MKKMNAIIIMIGLLLAGCATSTPTSTPATATKAPAATEAPISTPLRETSLVTSIKDIEGTWQRLHGGYVKFNRDGTFTCAPNLSQIEADEGAGLSRGNVWFDGTQLSIKVDYCSADSVGIYEIQRLESGSLQFEKAGTDECAFRIQFFVGRGSSKAEFKPTEYE